MSDDSPKKVVHLPRWRTDFPIGWEDDQYITRRELTKFLTLGSALLVGASAAVALAGRAREARTFEPRRVAGASALRRGESLLFRYPTDDDPCILVRTASDALVAFSQVCTHLSCAVVYRAADDHLYCPCHEGVFECAAGSGGAAPLAGPPERPLPRIVLETRGEDVFAVGVEA
jgi:nitrite reductase/ring-hydroxylating ferredoxin subunit